MANPDLHLVMLMAELRFIAAQTSVMLERDQFGGASLMVRGGIRGGQKTDLVVMQGNLNARRYIDDVLRPSAIPFLHNQGPGVTFQHDKARPTPP